MQADRLPGNVTEDLLGYASVLGGLRYDRDLMRRLVMGGRGYLRESSVWQWAVEEGEAAGRQKMLLEQGQDRFGPPTEAADAAVRAITDLDRLRRMGKRVLAATGWDDLLATPGAVVCGRIFT